jgi:small conductance mechanosensitive channel
MNDVDVPLSYDEDVKKIYETLTEVCERIKKIDTVEDSVFKGTQGFDDSAIRYRVRFFCKPINRPDTKRAVMREIQKGLDEAGIKIPYNQLDVHTYNKK